MSEVFYNKKASRAVGDEDEVVEEIWFKLENNEIVLHNEDGPAYIRTFIYDDKPNSLIEYRQNGRIHREDGPAVIHPTSAKEYFYRGHSADQLRLLAHAKGVTAESWEDLVKFAKREQI